MVGVLLAAALVAPPDVGATGPGAPLRYRVRTDAALTRMDVDVCFRGAPARVLTPGLEAAAPALIEARDEAGRPLPVRAGRIELAGVRPGTCVRYRLDLDRALAAARFSDRHGADVLTSAGAWLWRPAQLGSGGAQLRFDLPPGLSASTPWPRRDGEHLLDRSAFQRPSFTAFGRFRPHRMQRAGARIEVVRLGGGGSLDDAGIERALAPVIDGVASVRGRFPVAQLLVVLVPTEGAGIRFGMVRRGGGHSVALLTGRDSTAEELARSWVSWHELSHLLLPSLPPRDAWLYEGLATYYQEVLPARMGLKTPEDAWSALLGGLDRGARSVPRGTLTEASGTMLRTGAFMRVYWSGAAFALDADVALRRRGSSLDRVLAEPSVRDDDSAWSSERLFAAWDRSAGSPILAPLGLRYASEARFPDAGPLLARLGVGRDGGRAVLREAELSHLRDAIFRAGGHR